MNRIFQERESSCWMDPSGSFYNLFFYAYLSHGSITISPDDIWTQIQFAFSQLIADEPETFNDLFVFH